MKIKQIILLCLSVLISSSAWSRVFVRWTNAVIPPANLLGVTEIVFPHTRDFRVELIANARKQGYRVYLESPWKQAEAAAKACAENRCAGIILSVAESETTEAARSLERLRSTHVKLRFLMVDPDGKQPEMRGSVIVRHDAVLEVSSPTMQPWIDTNLALVRVEQRSRHGERPFYTFSWPSQEQQRALTADDYALAIGEAHTLHADLLLPVEEHLQEGLARQDASVLAFWSQLRPMLKFSAGASEAELEPAANVAVIVDPVDASEEVLNLLGRHNIPYQVFLGNDLKLSELKSFDIAIVLAKPDAAGAERLNKWANAGLTVVVVDAHGKYAWQSGQPLQVNEHTTSYKVGSGTVLELAEPVTDPETFAQDIRRLLGKRNALVSLWNGLTVIAAPYRERSGALKDVEFVNYAGEPLRVQVQVKGSFGKVRYESPERGCCENLDADRHDGFTEFVIPELQIGGRVHLEEQ